MHYAATNKTVQENTDPPRSFRFLASINNNAIQDKISRSEHFTRNLQECFERPPVLEAGYQLSENINLAHVVKVTEMFRNWSFPHGLSLILTANSPIKDMVLKSTLKELMSAKAVYNYKQKYWQAKANVASAADTPILTDDSNKSLTPGITTATVAIALKGLRQPWHQNHKKLHLVQLLVSLVRLLVKPVVLLRTQRVKRKI